MAKDNKDNKDKKGWYQNDKTVDFKDSWLQNTVELAALGAIVTGAGALAVKGDFSGAAKPGKKVFDVMVKGWENYLKRNGSKGGQFGYQVGKKVFFNMKKHPRVTGDERRNLLYSQIDDKMQNIDTKQLRKEVSKQIQNEGFLPPFTKERDIKTWDDVVDDILDNKDNIKDNRLKNKVKLLYQQSHDQQLKKDLNFNQPVSSKPKGKLFGNNNNDKSPLIDKKQLSRDMISAGVSGLAFGAGISGFHAVDRLSSDKDNQQKLEDTFQFGGSFLPKKEDEKMDKRAGALEFHNALKGIGKKTPEAIASGIGFTGVSLGAAKIMNDKKKKEEESGEPKGTRVIIELGDTAPELNDKNHATAGGLSLLPKFASEQSEGLSKLAFKGGSFVKDLFGHGDEIKRLETANYDDLAASQLKDSDVPSLLQQQYGNLVNDKSEAQFRNRLFDSKAKALKQDADAQIEELKTRTAKAQLTAGGAALGVGGGLAGIAYHNREDKNGSSKH
jgi:hypothetical protein